MEDKPKITSAFPGFRFHPTEEELLEFYLKNLALGKKLSQQFSNVIGFVNIYRHDPQDLPRLAIIGEREWYFFVPRDRKQSNGGRLNRTTKHGFWKATGSDRKVVTLSDPKRVIGYKKTLVFYQGRAPRGTKTDWIMNEYRLPDNSHLPKDVVLCKVYRKATSLKVLEQRAAKEEQQGEVDEEGYTMMYSSSAHQLFSEPSSSPLSSSNRPDYYYECPTGQQEEESIAYPSGNYYLAEPYSLAPKVLLEETQDDLMFFNQLAAAGGGDLHTAAENQCKLSADGGGLRSGCGSSLMLPFGLQELQVPKLEIDSAQDLHWASWLDHILKTPTAELLNF